MRTLSAVPHWDELAGQLDLDAADTLAGQIVVLQERRAEQMEAVDANYPLEEPTATRLALRRSRLAEIAVVEEALRDVGAPFEAAP